MMDHLCRLTRKLCGQKEGERGKASCWFWATLIRTKTNDSQYNKDGCSPSCGCVH